MAENTNIQERMIRQLPVKSNVSPDTDWLIIEGKDGTKKIKVQDVINSSLKDNLYYDSVNDMKNAVSVTEGSIIYTKGFSVSGDGGAARYEVEYNPGEYADGYFIIAFNNRPTLKAHLSVFGFVNPEQLGAYANGVDDDTDAIERLITSNLPSSFSKGKKYKIAKDLKIPSERYVNFNGCDLLLDNASIIIENTNRVFLENVNISCIGDSNGIIIRKSTDCAIMNANFTGIKQNKSAITIVDSSNIYIENTKFINETINGTGIYIYGQDNTQVLTSNIMINDTVFKDVEKCIHVYGLTEMNNISVLNTNIRYSNRNVDNIGVYVNALKSYVFINDIGILNGGSLLTIETGSESIVSINGAKVHNTLNVYELKGTLKSIVTLTGYHHYKYDIVKANNSVMCKMNCTLNICGTINSRGYDPKYLSVNHIGAVNDMHTPDSYITQPTEINLGPTTGSLPINDYKNMYINIVGTYDVSVIGAGLDGQCIKLVSSVDRKLKNTSSNIELFEASDITLHKYKGVTLIYLDGKWVQIQ